MSVLGLKAYAKGMFATFGSCVALLLAAGALRAAPVALPERAHLTEAQQLLKQMLRAENALTLSGEQTTTLVRAGKALTTTQRVFRKGSRALCVDYLQPPRFAGEEIVDNGRLYRHYVPSTNTLEIGPSRLMRLRGRVPLVMERVRRGALLVQLAGSEVVAGHPCSIVDVKPKANTEAARRRFWIDPTNGAQLRIEEYNAQGQRISVSSYTSIVYNPPMDAHTFHAPKTPLDVHVVALDPATPMPTIAQAQAQAGFPVREPSYLPAGFRFQSASVADYRGRKLVTLRYVNGLSILSVFETPQWRANDASQTPLPSHPRRNVVQAFQAGLRLILVGNLGSSEMERVLASLH